MQIAGLQKFTMVDYPKTIAATVFTRGCSFRCGFCHNPELVLPDQFNPLLDEDEVMEFFEKRKNQLEGVCITGGEPTLQKDLPEFIQKLKDLGYKIKLDSNGWNPEILEKIIASGNLDYIAMDIKSSPEKYLLATSSTPNIKGGGESIPDLLSKIKKSIVLIMNSGLDYEFRTTIVRPIHEVKDFEAIGEMIKGSKLYIMQYFVKSKQINNMVQYEPFSEAEMHQAKKIVEKYVDVVEIR